MLKRVLLGFLIIFAASPAAFGGTEFVTVKGSKFRIGGRPYYFIGANYWYGSLLGLESDKRRGVERLRKELDLLKANGVTNLRLMAGAEGSGPLNGFHRVGPPLQPEQNKLDASVLDGLDLVLDEMSRRGMRAVIFFSNNWEWSGGFQQYLIWNGVVSREWLVKKPSWDELRDIVAKFYSCEPCADAYEKQADFVLARTNRLNGRKYVEDPTIMSWELANEPRPMRPAANEAYRKWIARAAARIKRLAPRQLVTIGHEGRIGTESLELFEEVHADKNVDYLTVHIWPKNWGWITGGTLPTGYADAERLTVEYIKESAEVARRLRKPLVIEEFGLQRDADSLVPGSPVTFRDRYYRTVFSFVRLVPEIAGANFWAVGGTARPVPGQPMRKPGDEFTGDPPMEPQGLYSVFDIDRSTWSVIRSAARSASAR